jgi:hypothetical protein
MDSQIVLKEFVDMRICQWILNNFDKVIDTDQNNIYQLDDENKKYYNTTYYSSYLKAMLKCNGEYDVSYLTGNKGKKSHGRLYAQSFSLQYLPRKIRHTICKNDYYDIDMVNAQPSILLNLCQKYNIYCDRLLQYVNDRKTIIQKIIDGNPTLNITKEEIKMCILIILYGNTILPKFKDIAFMVSFLAEIKNITNELKNVYEKDFYVKKILKNIKVEHNINGKFLASLLQDKENEILMAVLEYLNFNNITVNTLIFDGLMIKKTNLNTPLNLDELNLYIKEKLNYTIYFEIKEMNEAIEIPLNEINNIATDKTYIFENESAAALFIIDELGDEILMTTDNSIDRYFLKIQQSLYEEDFSKNNIKLDNKILLFIGKYNIIIRQGAPKKNEKIASKNYRLVEGIVKYVKIHLVSIPKLIEKITENSINKICFRNGYINKLCEFKQYDNSIMVTSFIDRDFNPIRNEEMIEEIYKKILIPTFNDDDERTFFLTWTARGIFGHYNEKTMLIITGPRSSGKGVITELFYNSFSQKICGAFNADNLLTKQSQGEYEKSAGIWLLPLKDSRLMFSNEINIKSINGIKSELDNDTLKRLTSGGDIQKVRYLGKDPISMRLMGRFIILLNEIPKISSDDCMETVNIISLRSKFVSKITEEHEIINKNCDTFQYRLSDENIKQWVNMPDVYENFVHIICDHYKKCNVMNKFEYKKPESFEINKETFINSSDESYKKIIDKNIEFTYDKNDKVLLGDINRLLNENRINKSLGHNYLNEKGASKKQLYIGKHSSWYYLNIKMIEKE